MSSPSPARIPTAVFDARPLVFLDLLGYTDLLPEFFTSSWEPGSPRNCSGSRTHRVAGCPNGRGWMCGHLARGPLRGLPGVWVPGWAKLPPSRSPWS